MNNIDRMSKEEEENLSLHRAAQEARIALEKLIEERRKYKQPEMSLGSNVRQTIEWLKNREKFYHEQTAKALSKRLGDAKS